VNADHGHSALMTGARRFYARAGTAVPSDFVLLLVAGLLGLIYDAWTKPAPAAWLNPHLLFGAILSLWVVARFYRRMHQTPRLQPGDIRSFSRHLSRQVYLLLYLLMFAALSIGFMRQGSHGTPAAAAEDFQIYLAYGIVALVAIQALAALCRHLAAHSGTPIAVSSKRTADVA